MTRTLNSEALRELEAAAGSTPVNPALREWQREGGKVIGCMYHFIPEEVITAAGLLPIRLRATASTGTELSESCFTQVNCSLVRHFFDSSLRGEFDFLDGVVTVNNCDHIRRLYDNWRRRIRTPYAHFLSFPKKSGTEQVEAYRSEISGFRKSLEESFHVAITDERLGSAIRLHNETRRLQRQLYALRRSAAPPVTGAEALAVMVAGTAMPRERYNGLLSRLLEDCRNAGGHAGHTVRVMVVGGEIDDPRFIAAIESQGCLVVTDSLGYGSRSCMEEVDTAGDPVTALARYHVMERPADPRLFGTTFARNDYVTKMAREFRVDGVVSVRLPQCDHWGFEQVNLARHLRKNRLPHLGLEVEYILGGVGQLKTRVQAFLERIVEAGHDSDQERA
jgi:benzoyl-CoA reductase/2-hydroxyglutaryl-CoA dehydratase subunit BcrC/BadD/HgdB